VTKRVRIIPNGTLEGNENVSLETSRGGEGEARVDGGTKVMPDDLIELISKLFPVRAIAHSANEEPAAATRER